MIAKIKSWNFNYPTNGFAFLKMTYLKLYNAIIKTELKIAACKTACYKTVVLQFESVIFVEKFRKKEVFSQPDVLALGVRCQ